MREQGKDAEPPKPTHTRGASRTSFSGRKLSVSQPLQPVPNEKKKNALVKESEYGVHGIKVPLTEVAVKAEEVWGPALGGRDKEETLKAILESLESNRGLFEVGSTIQDAIRRKDHETIIEEYKRARKYTEDARYIVEQANYSKMALTDAQIHQIIVTARMWADVERQIEHFKRDAWKRLASTHFTKHQTGTEDTKSDEYMSLISIMLELGVEDNPIWIWLLSRYEHLKSRLNIVCERSRVEIEVLRRHLANGEKPTLRAVQKHLRAVPISTNATAEPTKMDAPKVVEFWEHVHASMTALLSTKGGLLGELIEFWDIAQSFISGRAQRNMPTGYQNQSSVHHKLTDQNKIELENDATELINIIREHLYSFFSDPPIEDVSALFSPLPTTPIPTTPRTPLTASLSPTAGSRFKFDPNNVPPPSPSRGETWEKYAFWPPHSNALSGSYYLSKSLVLVGTAANELASLRLPETGSTSRLDEALRLLVGGVRERCISAICAAWNADAEKLKVLEDWTRNADRKDTTNLPQRFLAVQSFLLNHLQKIMYVEASSKTSVDVVVPPSNKLLQMLRSQFVTSLYRTLSGMVECAELGRKALGQEFEDKGDDLTMDGEEDLDGEWGKVDSTNKVSPPPPTPPTPHTYTNAPAVHPPPPHPLQHVALQPPHLPLPPHPLRNPLQRAAQRRNRAHPRRPLAAGHAALQILHQAARPAHRRLDRRRHLLPALGRARRRPHHPRRGPRAQPLRQHRAAAPRHAAQPDQHYQPELPAHGAHTESAVRGHRRGAYRRLLFPAAAGYLAPAADAGDARCGVHLPDAGDVHDGCRVPDADGYLRGAGSEDG